MKYVTYMGAVYKLTDRNYRKFLQDVIDVSVSVVGDYGTFLGYLEATDMTKEEAKKRLEYA